MPPPPRKPNQPVSDIDRFLQEVDRLRRKSADEPQPPPQARAPQRKEPSFDDVQEVLPATAPPPPVVLRPRKPRRYDDVEVVSPSAPPPVIRPAPAPGFTATPASTVATIATVAEVATIATIATVAAPKAAGQSRKGPSDNTLKVVALLRGNGLRTAMMLREILDPPLSKRRRR